MKVLILALAILLNVNAFAYGRNFYNKSDDKLDALTLTLGFTPECIKEAEKFSDDFSHYEIEGTYGSYNATPEDALGLQRQIVAIVRGRLKHLEKTACFKPVSLYYALATYRDRIRPPGHWESGMANGWTKLIALFYLAKEGRLVPISQAERARLGGMWTAKTGSRSQIMGSYDCGSNTIFFDPYSPPHDLAALLSHELDHLLRDKWLPLDVTKLNFAEYMLLDETLASLHAALLESRGLKYGAPAPLIPNTVREINLRQYIDFDLTLFDRKGHAQALAFDYIQLRQKLGTNNETDVTYRDRDLSLTELLQSLRQMTSAQEHIQAILKVVAGSYFKTTKFDFKKLTKFIIDSGNGLSPDSMWQYLTSRTEQVFASDKFSDAEIAHAFDPNARLFIAPIQGVIEQLRSGLATVSGTCQKFMSEKDSPELSGYLGSTLPVPVRPGDAGSRPGDQGSRPAMGIRPCLVPQRGI